GQLKNFTGIDSPYERPDDAEITIEGATQTAEQATLTIVKALETQGLIPSS
ncbi:MAG: adenylyl-sulfate kinase, partial [Nitrospira sp.]|nr:adenylyl-sulfate kinase [Nitrospira sp.]